MTSRSGIRNFYISRRRNLPRFGFGDREALSGPRFQIVWLLAEEGACNYCCFIKDPSRIVEFDLNCEGFDLNSLEFVIFGGIDLNCRQEDHG